MPALRRKILAIPYVRRVGKKTRFLVVQDDESGEWTFISGTCEPKEPATKCVLREVFEETKGLVHLRKLPKKHRVFRIVYQDKRIDVFFIPLRMEDDKMHQMQCEFLNTETNIVEMNENRMLRFETLAQFKRRANLWDFIEHVMSLSEFHRLCPNGV